MRPSGDILASESKVGVHPTLLGSHNVKFSLLAPREAAQARCETARLAVGVYCFGPGVARVINSTNILPNFAMSTSICACTSGRSRAGLMRSDHVT